ncbi:FtsJ methyltransferase domain-containing protein 2 [Clydaea vesicula]|uniref:Cap-specific mRNA (nucleoside-2'-O-)-methyltransferase 1 n=1 Tax=Clydaea vesicula TaxID=447962 RepID=A0AAD5XUI5_9FUNG|nr:FtsJ methyltransferase domain-containing protein 2 [Clydaea vesicula]
MEPLNICNNASLIYNYDEDPDYIKQTAISYIPPPNRHLDFKEPEEICFTLESSESLDVNFEKLLSIKTEKFLELDFSIFSDKNDLNELLKLKETLSKIPSHIFQINRKKANPTEFCSVSIFQNRSAVKLANLDYALINFRRKYNFNSFLDLCSGPGGFTEYLYWRVGFNLKGLGITLKGVQDFKPPLHPNFKPFYGKDGTGDITVEQNFLALSEFDQFDFVLADGGVACDEDKGNQEEHVKQLILCEIISAFITLRKDGDFLLKLFDALTPFTVELIYLLHKSFQKISLIKPVSSRPSNSEKYIYCEKFKFEKPPLAIITHLKTCNFELNKLNKVFFDMNSKSNQMSRHSNSEMQNKNSFITLSEKIELGLLNLTDIMNRSVVLNDGKFMNFIRSFNKRFYLQQFNALAELIEFCNEPQKYNYDRNAITKFYFQRWNIEYPEEIIPYQNDESADSRKRGRGRGRGKQTKFISNSFKDGKYNYTQTNRKREAAVDYHQNYKRSKFG